MTIRVLSVVLLFPLIGGCTHPIDIIGEGDIRSASGNNDCLLEERPCEAVAVNEYVETYSAQARPGYSFVGWENCLTLAGENCVFDVSTEIVHKNWKKTMPTLVAKFAPVCEAAPADSFAAIQSAIFDGKGCSNSSCHRSPGASGSMDLSAANAYNDIVDVTARSGGGLKRVLRGDATNSYLYRKVAVRTDPGSFNIAGSPMPLNNNVLSGDELAALAAWIDAGAPRSGRADEFNKVEQLLGLCD